MQGMIMVLGLCPFPHCHLYIYTKFYLNANNSVKNYLPDKVPYGLTEKAATICSPLWGPYYIIEHIQCHYYLTD